MKKTKTNRVFVLKKMWRHRNVARWNDAYPDNADNHYMTHTQKENSSVAFLVTTFCQHSKFSNDLQRKTRIRYFKDLRREEIFGTICH